MNRNVRYLVQTLAGVVVFLFTCFILAILNDIIVNASPGSEVTNSGSKVALSLVLFSIGVVLAVAAGYRTFRLVRVRLMPRDPVGRPR